MKADGARWWRAWGLRETPEVTLREVPEDGECCEKCGHFVAQGCPTYWLASDDLWNEVEGGPRGIRCIPCFTRDCQEQGIAIFWRAEREAPAQGHGARRRPWSRRRIPEGALSAERTPTRPPAPTKLVPMTAGRAVNAETEVEALRDALGEILSIYNDDKLSPWQAESRAYQVARDALEASPPQGGLSPEPEVSTNPPKTCLSDEDGRCYEDCRKSGADPQRLDASKEAVEWTRYDGLTVQVKRQAERPKGVGWMRSDTLNFPAPAIEAKIRRQIEEEHPGESYRQMCARANLAELVARDADQERQRIQQALEVLIPWARRAFDGLEYEDEREREDLWEELAGTVDEMSVLQKAEVALSDREER